MTDLSKALVPTMEFNIGEYSVYEHVFKNGKKYIGMAKDPQRRWNNGEGYKDNTEMYKAILEEGWENVEHNIILSGLFLDQASKLERYLIKLNDSIKNGYNKSTGGEAGHNRYSKSVNKVLNACDNYIELLDIVGDITALRAARDNEEFAIKVNYIDNIISNKFEDYNAWWQTDQLGFCVNWLCNLKYALGGGDLSDIKFFNEVGSMNIQETLFQEEEE